MNVTPQQKHVIDCVLSIFETGRIPSSKSYGTCTILKDGAGISYGKHQCTDKANSLDLVCRKYIELDGQLADSLSSYMVYLQTNESSKVNPAGPYPTWLESLMNLLRSAGSDPMMQRAQDEIFDEFYWNPALKHVNNIGLKTALGHLVCYDSTIHSGAGGVTIIRKLFPQKSPLNGGDEKEWIYAYINARKNWLLSSSNQLVRNSASRMDSLKAIADSNNWELKTPLTIKGVKIQ